MSIPNWMKPGTRNKLIRSVYGMIDKKKKGYGWIKEGQNRAMRDIFNIPNHIPSNQVVKFIKEYRKKERREDEES